MFAHKDHHHDLIIVGMGPAGTAAFIQWVNQLITKYGEHLPQLSVALIEKNMIAGPGTPYDPNTQDIVLRVNNPNRRMNLLDLPGDESDFLNWMQENKDTLIDIYGDCILDYLNENDLYAPRQIFGDYCEGRLKEYIEKAKQAGIRVSLFTQCEVVRGEKKQHWKLYSKEHKFVGKHLLITTGHLLPRPQRPELQDSPNYLDSPYGDEFDRKVIADLKAGENIFIIGSGLSAIDAAKLLNLRITKQTKNQSKIYMISPSGGLPKIKPRQTIMNPYILKYMTPENLDKHPLLLRTVLNLFVQELQEALHDETFNLEKMMMYARFEHTDDPKQAFFDDVTLEASLEQPSDLQRMFLKMWMQSLRLIWNNLSPEESAIFQEQYFRYYVKWAAGMTFENALEMKDLIERDILHLVKAPTDMIHYNPVKECYTLGQIEGKYLINGAGLGYNIKDNPLLSDLLRQGLIKQVFPSGGLAVAKDFSLIRGDGELYDNAWSIGVVTYGCNPSANAVTAAMVNAKSVIENILYVIARSTATNQSSF